MCFPGRVVVVQEAEIETRVLQDIEIVSFDPYFPLLHSLPHPLDLIILFFLDVKLKGGRKKGTTRPEQAQEGGARVFCRMTQKGNNSQGV